MRKKIVFLAVICILLSSSFCYAIRPAVRHVDPISVEIVSDNGIPFRSVIHKNYLRDGTRITKKYLEARKGSNYSIIVRNRTSGRIGVVIAVDGRNIISGKMSNLGSNERMYLIDPYGYAKFQGWRTDSSTVHKFYFTDVSDSYSAKTFGDTSAMGVIAVAAYREKVKDPIVYREKSIESPSAASSPRKAAKGAPSLKDESAGTGFGESVYAPVKRVHFEPVAVAAQKVLIKYEWRSTLCRKGVFSCEPDRDNEGNRLWDDDGYAPYPPDHREN